MDIGPFISLGKDIGSAISLGKSLVEISKGIAKLIDKAQASPDVARRLLLYLQAAQDAIAALGLERQWILSEVRHCDVGDAKQVRSLWKRLDRYLHQDNIRPLLVKAITGMAACRMPIEKGAEAAWWRRHDKQTAVAEFSKTLSALEYELQMLSSNFLPGSPSGMGVHTLIPIFDLISTPTKQIRHFKDSEIEGVSEELGRLACQALQDPSHEDWFRLTGRVEGLVAQLQLAFSVKVTSSVFKAGAEAS
jgi:hypothetical protein